MSSDTSSRRSSSSISSQDSRPSVASTSASSITRSDRPDVRIVEVGPRDGLQNITHTIPTATKLGLIDRLSRTGLQAIEITSVVSPKKIPQLADCKQILSDNAIQHLLEDDDQALSLPVLVPNLRGLEMALSHNVKEIAVFLSCTEPFSKANINCTIAESLTRAREVVTHALFRGVRVRGYVSCIFHDPYLPHTQSTPHSSVHSIVKQLLSIGCYEISLGDTLGTGTPSLTYSLLSYLLNNGIPPEKLAGHFHDTYSNALSNIWTAYEMGIRVFDASVAGLGGCPFAPGAKGNIATEALVELFEGKGVRTGVDLEMVKDVGRWITSELSMEENLSRDKSKDISRRRTLNWHQL
jgi:hydroxymethylglutaryl-CoA lyase